MAFFTPRQRPAASTCSRSPSPPRRGPWQVGRRTRFAPISRRTSLPTTPTWTSMGFRQRCSATISPTATMQLDVYANPLVRARRAAPNVVLEANVAASGRERVIAFLAGRAQIGPVGGKLMPIVEIGGRGFVLLMPSITNVPANEPRSPAGNLAVFRDRIVAADDWMLLGIWKARARRRPAVPRRNSNSRSGEGRPGSGCRAASVGGRPSWAASTPPRAWPWSA